MRSVGLTHLSEAALRHMNRWIYCHHHRGMARALPVGRQPATKRVVFLCPTCGFEVEVGHDATRWRLPRVEKRREAPEEEVAS